MKSTQHTSSSPWVSLLLGKNSNRKKQAKVCFWKNATVFYAVPNTVNIMLSFSWLDADFIILYWNNNSKDYHDKDILKVKLCYFLQRPSNFSNVIYHEYMMGYLKNRKTKLPTYSRDQTYDIFNDMCHMLSQTPRV